MIRAVITALIITILIVLAFITFLCIITNVTQEEEEIPLLPHHYVPNQILQPKPSITIHDSVSY